MKKMAFFCCLENNKSKSNHEVKGSEKSSSHVYSIVNTLNCSCECGFHVCSAAVLHFENSNQSFSHSSVKL